MLNLKLFTCPAPIANAYIPRKLRRINLLSFLKSGRQDSNLRPPVPKTGALPGCATPRFIGFAFRMIEVGATGFEPATTCSQNRSATGLRYTPLKLTNNFCDDESGRQDSNLRPPVPKTGALPGCATPRSFHK